MDFESLLSIIAGKVSKPFGSYSIKENKVSFVDNAHVIMVVNSFPSVITEEEKQHLVKLIEDEGIGLASSGRIITPKLTPKYSMLIPSHIIQSLKSDFRNDKFRKTGELLFGIYKNPKTPYGLFGLFGFHSTDKENELVFPEVYHADVPEKEDNEVFSGFGGAIVQDALKMLTAGNSSQSVSIRFGDDCPIVLKNTFLEIFIAPRMEILESVKRYLRDYIPSGFESRTMIEDAMETF